MCDTASERGRGWTGWMDLPQTAPPAPAGPWIDCSWPIAEDMPRVAVFPPPTIRRIKSMPGDPLNVTEFGMVVHTGTHVDAPRHFFMDGPPMEEIPLDRLCGPGVVWHLDKGEHALIEPADLERATPRMRPGDIVAVDTGWAARHGTPAYDEHPSFSLDAAKWLVAHKARLVACDFGTPDLPLHRRGDGFDWPVHKELLAHGVLICEHLTGHAPLAGASSSRSPRSASNRRMALPPACWRARWRLDRKPFAASPGCEIGSRARDRQLGVAFTAA